MKSKINYQKSMDALLSTLAEKPVKRLLLHSCCAPCSSYVIEYLSDYFELTVFYYNPNITSSEEYRLRLAEEQRFVREFKAKNPVSVVAGEYEPRLFFEAAKGLEAEPEGGARCLECFRLRLSAAAEYAAQNGFDYFATTLTVSPLKNADDINSIGGRISKAYGVEYLPSDFKKKNGYKRSIELSAEYSLYRQSYCGCVFSKNSNDIKAPR